MPYTIYFFLATFLTAFFTTFLTGFLATFFATFLTAFLATFFAGFLAAVFLAGLSIADFAFAFTALIPFFAAGLEL